jgi:hypothetical protein
VVLRLPAAALALTLAGCAGPTVIRVIDGRELPGRFVSEHAYALYARGAEAEAHGDRASARLDYLAAADEDDKNVEIWTRIGAVSCALGRKADARSAFDRAAARADDYEPLFRERAACALAAGALGPAEAKAVLDDASRALALDPRSEETVLLYARAAEAAGERTLAERALRELVATSPGRVAGWQALRTFAVRHADPAAAARAAAAIDALDATEPAANGAAEPASLARRAPGPLDDVDAALARDALDDARTAAKRARLSPAELAVRAAALGRAQLARVQADLVHRADPTSASAAIALAIACDLLRADTCLAGALSDTAARTTPPSLLARLLFAELVARRTDTAAARAWLGPITALTNEPDALLTAVAARVAARLRP